MKLILRNSKNCSFASKFLNASFVNNLFLGWINTNWVKTIRVLVMINRNLVALIRNLHPCGVISSAISHSTTKPETQNRIKILAKAWSVGTIIYVWIKWQAYLQLLIKHNIPIVIISGILSNVHVLSIINVLHNSLTLYKRVIGSKRLCPPSHRFVQKILILTPRVVTTIKKYIRQEK